MLAIVIPYYKLSFFEETLDSLSKQKDKRFHVYIGDDASPECPKNVLKKYEDKFPFTYHRFTENLGGTSLVKQWERCLNRIHNETWVQLLGDDDVLGEDVVSCFYNSQDNLNAEQSSVIRFATQVIDGDSQIISRKYEHPKLETATAFLIRKFKGGTRSSLSEYMFKAKELNRIGFQDFPLAWSSDVLAVVEFSNNNNIYTINNAIVSFRLSDKNITGQGESIEKNVAWFNFHYYLIKNYGKQYPKELVETLFDRIENVQLNNKKTPERWLRLFCLYLWYGQYSRFFTLPSKIKTSIK